MLAYRGNLRLHCMIQQSFHAENAIRCTFCLSTHMLQKIEKLVNACASVWCKKHNITKLRKWVSWLHANWAKWLGKFLIYQIFKRYYAFEIWYHHAVLYLMSNLSKKKKNLFSFPVQFVSYSLAKPNVQTNHTSSYSNPKCRQWVCYLMPVNRMTAIFNLATTLVHQRLRYTGYSDLN